MLIATSRNFIAIVYNGYLELWQVQKNIQTLHSLASLDVVKIECIAYGVLALTRQGRVYTFTQQDKELYPSPEVIVDIATTEHDVIMTTRDGKFIKMGKRGQTLRNLSSSIYVSMGPAQICYISEGHLWSEHRLIPHHCRVKQVSVGGGHTVFLDEMGDLYGYGRNHRGQLGKDLTLYYKSPVKIPLASSAVVAKLVSGFEHTAILDTDHHLWITGSNYAGQHGPDAEGITLCSFGFQRVRSSVGDIYARGNLTLILFLNGDVEQFGTR